MKDITQPYSRVKQLRSRLADEGVDGLLISKPANRRYLSGFTATDSPGGGSSGWLMVTADAALLFVSPLNLEQARWECPGWTVVEVAGNRLAQAVGQAISASPAQKVACEGNHISHLSFLELQAALPEGTELVPIDGWVERMRSIKDEAELAAIRRAAELTDRAMAHVLAFVRPGVTERQVAWEAERMMRESGAEGLAFEVGVASGPNSAIPHWHPTEREIGAGEPIWVDMGAKVDGYCADLTRSFCLGQPDERLVEVWHAARAAQAAAIAGCRSGLSGAQVDGLARDLIAAAGYGPNFGHSLGHGVGLVVHELPRLSSVSDDLLVDGMVATFEPGIYLPGWGGVRLEDLGVIRAYGVQLISAAELTLAVA